MRAAWVTAIPPAVDGGGGHIRQAHLFAALAARFEVHLVVGGGPPHPDVAALAASVTEVAAASSAPPSSRAHRRASDLWSTVVRGRAPEVAAHDQVRARLGEALDTLPAPDLVQVEFLGLAPLVEQRRGGHWSITLHNLPSGMEHQRADVAAGRRQRALHRRAAVSSRRAEQAALAAYDTTIVCSDADAASLGGTPLVVPNGVDLDRFRASPVPTGGAVLFVGALNTAPNVEGLRWFVHHVWPLVRAARPDARLRVVGMAPVPEAQTTCDAPGVTLHADVADTLPFLHDARVAVVPLHIGTGSRLKALEAMAAGRPVVGTTIGLGGIDAQPGRHVEVADDPAAFAAAVVRVLADDAAAAALAAAGRALVETRYGWDSIGRAYVDAMVRRVASGGSCDPG